MICFTSSGVANCKSFTASFSFSFLELSFLLPGMTAKLSLSQKRSFVRRESPGRIEQKQRALWFNTGNRWEFVKTSVKTDNFR
jgi:hypothetical protein